MKKIVSILLVFTMCFTLFCTTASASEIENPVYETIIGGEVNTRASSAPSSFYNLGGDNNYTATLIDLAASKGSYTKYYFATSTGNIYLRCSLERSGTTTDKNRYLIIYLYEKADATSSGKLLKTETIHFKTAETTIHKSFTELDTNKFYYIRFYNNSSTDSGSSLDISGTILVDDTYNS